MSVKCGIVGLPNVGKSTLFNALTKSGIAAENYPFCTIEPNIGIVEVPDARMQALADIVKPQRMQYATTEFVDIAGLVAGASKGEGLGNQFLANIRETDGIVNVVRCFEDDNVVHVAGKVDPISDIGTIITELALADLTTVEKAQERNQKVIRSGDKEAAKLGELLVQVTACLNEGKPARTMKLDAPQRALLKPLCLLTMKPVMYVANVAEKGFTNNPLLTRVEEFAAREGAPVVAICAALESEIAVLSDEEKREFLVDIGMTEPGLNRLIRAAFQLLGLQTYFTAGVKEVRAWTIHIGDTAPQAAGVIHGDFEKGFIRAEVIGYDDYIACKGKRARRKRGRCGWKARSTWSRTVMSCTSASTCSRLQQSTIVASAFSHALVALTMGKLSHSPVMDRRALGLGVLCAVLPDIDVIGFGHGIQYGDLWGHRGLTHSLTFAALLSAVLVALCYRRESGTVMAGMGLYFFLSAMSHGVLDAMTDGGLGVAFFSPFDTTRHFFSVRPIAVSPIGIHEFFSDQGLHVLASEAKWIWLPAAMVFVGRRTLKQVWRRCPVVPRSPAD